MFGRAVTQQLVATTSGIRRATAAAEASGALTVTIDDGTAHWIDLGRSASRLDVTASVARALAQARAARGRIDLPAGTYEVVLGAEAAGELLGFLPDIGFSGTLAAAGIGITAQAGRSVAAALVDVADDGGADVGLPIDFACFLIEDGRLTTPLNGMRFTESVLTVLAGVQAVGADVKSQPVMNVWNAAISAPPLRSTSFRLGAAPIAPPA